MYSVVSSKFLMHGQNWIPCLVSYHPNINFTVPLYNAKTENSTATNISESTVVTNELGDVEENK